MKSSRHIFFFMNVQSTIISRRHWPPVPRYASRNELRSAYQTQRKVVSRRVMRAAECVLMNGCCFLLQTPFSYLAAVGGETYSWLQGVKILALALTSERRVIFWERLPYFAPVLELLLERVPLPARTVASEGDQTAAAASPRLTFKYVKGKTVRWAQIGDKK